MVGVSPAFRVGVVTLFPQMFEALTRYGISGRAVSRGLLDIDLENPRTHTDDVHQTVDDRPYGGGPGMLMKPEPLLAAIAALQARGCGRATVIHLSPQGRPLTQGMLRELVRQQEQHRQLILVASRYEGVDQRVVELAVDLQVSVGDFVVSGGELPAMLVMDGLIRLLPGALGDAASTVDESFAADHAGAGGLLEYPQYTRPEVLLAGDGTAHGVPEVLRSGNHAAIARWRRRMALGMTWAHRPELLRQLQLNEDDRQALAEFVAEWLTNEDLSRPSPVGRGDGMSQDG